MKRVQFWSHFLKCIWGCHYFFPFRNLTYTHNWPLHLFCQDYGLTSHTTHVVCINFIHEWRHLHFTVDSEKQIFVNNFNVRFSYPQSFCLKFSFRCLTWDIDSVFTTNKQTHFLLGYGDSDHNKCWLFSSPRRVW